MSKKRGMRSSVVRATKESSPRSRQFPLLFAYPPKCWKQLVAVLRQLEEYTEKSDRADAASDDAAQEIVNFISRYIEIQQIRDLELIVGKTKHISKKQIKRLASMLKREQKIRRAAKRR